VRVHTYTDVNYDIGSREKAVFTFQILHKSFPTDRILIDMITAYCNIHIFIDWVVSVFWLIRWCTFFQLSKRKGYIWGFAAIHFILFHSLRCLLRKRDIMIIIWNDFGNVTTVTLDFTIMMTLLWLWCHNHNEIRFQINVIMTTRIRITISGTLRLRILNWSPKSRKNYRLYLNEELM
jgi:hypothetical protein